MNSLLNLLKNSKSVIISTHINPDPDAIGSGLALFHAIKKNYAIDVKFIIDDRVPDFDFLDLKDIYSFEHLKEIKEVDLMIVVDAPNLDRIGKCSTIKRKTLVNIDHHISNNFFGDLNIVNIESSSTCEEIFYLIKSLKLDNIIADCIYAGLIADTGNFSWGNLTERTFECASALQKLGADILNISKKIFYTKSLGRLRLLGYALTNFVYIEKIKLAYFYLKEEDLIKFNAKQEDAHGIVDLLKSLDNADIAILFRDKSELRASVRSENIDVSKMSAIFNGGGHKKAAGFSTKLTLDETLKAIENYLEGM